MWVNLKHLNHGVKIKSKSEAVVKQIRRKTCRKYSSEEKIRIILDGLGGEDMYVVKTYWTDFVNSVKIKRMNKKIHSNDERLLVPLTDACIMLSIFS